MSDILTDEQLYEHWSKYGGYQSSCDNVINDVKQEAYFDEEIIELLTIAKWLDAQRAALQARVAALEAALKAIADGDAIEFAEKFGIEIPTCDTDWSYDGVYYERLHENIAWAALDQPVSQQPDGGEA
jgi:hypothetical protein